MFAPTDEAFALLGEDTINALLEDTDTLSDILLYHVISDAEVDSTGAIAAAGSTVETLGGSEVPVAINDSRMLTVGGATVTEADINATNGVIHVIDAVIMPPAE